VRVAAEVCSSASGRSATRPSARGSALLSGRARFVVRCSSASCQLANSAGPFPSLRSFSQDLQTGADGLMWNTSRLGCERYRCPRQLIDFHEGLACVTKFYRAEFPFFPPTSARHETRFIDPESRVGSLNRAATPSYPRTPCTCRAHLRYWTGNRIGRLSGRAVTTAVLRTAGGSNDCSQSRSMTHRPSTCLLRTISRTLRPQAPRPPKDAVASLASRRFTAIASCPVMRLRIESDGN
jgi:hypothetical protein